MFLETVEDGKGIIINIDHIQAVRVNDQGKADIITSKYTFHIDETYTDIRRVLSGNGKRVTKWKQRKY